MDNDNPQKRREDFILKLQDSSAQLVQKLQEDKLDEASEIINGLVEARDSHIFNSVGTLTRALHEAIVNFNVDAELESLSLENNSSEISDASDRLHYVIKLTQTAANKTLDKVEILVPITTRLGGEASELKNKWSKLKVDEINKEEFNTLYKSVDEFLDQMGSGTAELTKNLQDIIIEQSYQDITGQVLEKVIGLIKDVESELVNLMRIAGHVEKVAGLANEKNPKSEKAKTPDIAAEGPQIPGTKRSNVLSGQDEVDDLLSSLGF